MSQFDTDLLHFLNRAGESPVGDAIFVGFTILGMLLVCLLVAPALWFKGKRNGAFDLVSSLLIVSVVVELIKIVSARDRPFEVLGDSVNSISYYGLAESSGFSFPSGHAARIFAVATIVSLNVKLPAKVVSFSVAAMVALSRIYLGLHWPTDIVAGAIIGVSLALALTIALPKWNPYAALRERTVSAVAKAHL